MHHPSDATEGTSGVLRGVALGVLGGLMAGLFGVGGGIVLVPGLVLVAKLAQHAAHATSLAAILLTAPAALIPFALEGQVSWPAAAALAAGALIGAIGGADLMARIPADRLRLLFGAFMILIAVRLVLSGSAEGAGVAVEITPVVLAGLFAAGLATGLLSALMGVGGGVVMVPVMVVGFGFDQLLAEGTSLAVIIPTALAGSIRHASNGYTRWRLGLIVGAGGVAGGLVGGTVAQQLPAAALQSAFAVLLVVAGIRLIRRGRAQAPAATTTEAPDDPDGQQVEGPGGQGSRLRPSE